MHKNSEERSKRLHRKLNPNCQCWRVFCGRWTSSDSPHGWGHQSGKVSLGINPFGVHHYLNQRAHKLRLGCLRPKSYQEVQPHPPADDQFKLCYQQGPAQQCKTQCFTPTVYPIRRLTQGSGRISKNHSPTATKTKTTYRVHLGEKAESYAR